MPEIYDDPAAPIANAEPEQPRPRQVPDPSEALADHAMVSAQRTTQIFRNSVRDLAVQQAPDTIAWTAVAQNDEVTTAATNDAIEFFSSIYGSEDLAAFVKAELLEDSGTRDSTIATLEVLRGYSGSVSPAAQLAYMHQGGDPGDLMASVLGGTRTVESLSIPEKAAVAGIAGEMLDQLEAMPDPAGVAGDLNTAIAVGTSGDVSMALSADQIALLESYREQFKYLNEMPTLANKLGIGLTPEGTVEVNSPETFGNTMPGTTADVGFTIDDPGGGLTPVGIQQVRRLEAGVVVLNDEWAKQNPEEAFAVRAWLEANYPDMQVQIGAEGAFGSFLDKFGMGVDYLSAPIGGGLTQLSEIAERVGRSDEEKAQGLADADRVEALIQGGTLSEDETEQAMRVAAHLREDATDEVGMGAFAEQVYRNTAPRTIGTGFGDSFTRAIDLLPGDPGYGAAFAISSLVANIALDPTNFLIGYVGAVRAARLAPKFRGLEAGALSVDDVAQSLILAEPALTDAQAAAAATRIVGMSTQDVLPNIGRGVIKNYIYQGMARYADEIPTTKPFMQAQTYLYKLRTELGEREFSAALGMYGLDGESARLIAGAKSEGDMGLVLSRQMTGADQPAVHLDALLARRNELAARLEADVPSAVSPMARSEVEALNTELGWVEDVIAGRDWVRPFKTIPSTKQLRKLARLSDAPMTPYQRVLFAGQDFVEKFPSSILRLPSRDLAKAAKGVKGGEQSARQFLSEMQHLYRSTGAGEVLTFPHTSPYASAIRRVGAEITENAVETSFGAITDLGKFLGIRNRRLLELMAPWTSGELTSASKSYYWWRDTWQTMISESPKLTATGKAELKQMWHSLISDRSPGFVSTTTVGGHAAAEPTWYRSVLNPVTGKIERHGVPVFEADQFQTWRLPSLRDLRAHMALVSRTANDWSKAGPARRAVSGAHAAISESWSTTNSMWRNATLGFRLIGALPARIGLESAIRIGGYGYASAVWHPVEWFASTRIGTQLENLTDLALFADSPVHSLGAMVNDVENMPNFYLARAGRESVQMADGLPYYRAYSDRIGRLFASNSVHEFYLPHMDDAAQAVGVMGRSDRGLEVLGQIEEFGMDPLDAVRRAQTEIAQLIGSGPGADQVQAALRTGRALVDGETIRVGTADFSEWLQGLVQQGWVPGPEFLARSAGDYLPAARIPALRTFRDKMFKAFYAGPDVAMTRSPLYRQIAAREFRDMVARGYSPGTALRLSRANAAEMTSDMMFTIGAKTSGEYFLRNVNPFFPAYRELSATWLRRLPMRIGEGHWGLGMAAIARRGDVWLDFLTNAGVVHKDEQGKLYVPLPNMTGLVQLLTGNRVTPGEVLAQKLTGTYQELQFKSPLDSFAGILPVPIGLLDEDEQGNPLPWYERLKGIMPSLGGPSSVALGIVNDIMGGALDDAENWLTLYGTDQSLGPMAVDRFFEAFGITMPWMTGTTRDYHEAVRTWSVVDGMRIAMQNSPTPDWREYDSDGDGYLTPGEQEKFAKVYTGWAEDITEQGERYAMGTYLFRSISGMVMPFSVQISDEGKQKTKALWGLINALPDEAGGGSLSSPLIDSFLTEYPELGSYMVGKNQDLRAGAIPEDETIDEFMQAVKDGQIVVRNPTDWVAFSLGMNSYAVYQSRLDAIYEEAGDSPADWLLNFDGKEQVQLEKQKWQSFLDLSEVRENWLNIPGEPPQEQSFAEMFDTYMEFRRIHAGEKADLTLEQQHLLNFDTAMREYAKYFSPNPESSEDYFKMREQAFAALEGPGGGPLSEGVGWWFESVSDPYYTERNRLYDLLDTTNERDKALVYQQIRSLADEYNRPYTNPDHPEWGEFPSPEEYVFAKLDKADRDAQIAQWASLPATFLTEFQREQAGYDIPEGKQDEASQLADIITEGDRRFDQYVAKNNLSYSSTDVINYRQEFDQFYADQAHSLGLDKYWKALNQPEYKRIGSALGFESRTPAWKWLVQTADSLNSIIDNAEYGTKTSTRHMYEKWMSQAIDEVSKDDGEFKAIIGQLRRTLGEDDNPLTTDDLVLSLFFNDNFSASNAYWMD